MDDQAIDDPGAAPSAAQESITIEIGGGARNCSFIFNVTEGDSYSDIIYVNETSGERTGLIYSVLSPASAGAMNRAAEWGALLAVQDFNLRNIPTSVMDANKNMTEIGAHAGDCNLRLRIQFDTYDNLMGLGTDYQENVLLLNESFQQPMAILGAVSSEASALLATLGAVAVQPYLGVGQRCDVSWTFPALKILNISPCSSSVALDDRNRFPYFARAIPFDAVDAEALCRYLMSIGVTQLAVLYHLDLYNGQFYDNGMKQAASKHNITLHGFSFGDFTVSMRQAVEWLYETPLRYVYCAGQLGEWSHLLRLLHEYGMLGRETSRGKEYAWFFSASLTLDIQGGSLPVDVLSYLNGTALISLQTPKKAMEIQRQQFQKASKDASFQQMWRESHSQASDAVGLFRNGSVSLQVPEPSLLALLTYDSVLAVGLAACQVNATRFPSVKVHDKLRGLSFTGLTGKVELDQVTASRRPYSVAYSIQNVWYDAYTNDTTLLPSIEVRPGLDNELGVFVHQPLIYPSGSTVPPESVESLSANSVQGVPPGLLLFLWGLIAIAIICSVGCAVWTVLQRNHPKVRAAQPIFLFCLCCGTFLVALSTIFVTWGEPMSVSALDAACIADPWFLSIGLTTIFAALFSKIWRIDRVYRNARAFRRVTVRARDVLWPFLILLAVNLVILIVWTILFPTKWTEVTLDKDPYGRVTSVRYTCYPEQDAYEGSMACLYVLLAVSAFALLLLNIVSYRARHLPSEFNETTYIGMTNLILLEALVICLPLIMASRGQRAGFIATRTLLNFVICLGVLLPTFIPKFIVDTRDKDQRLVRTVSPLQTKADVSVLQKESPLVV